MKIQTLVAFLIAVGAGVTLGCNDHGLRVKVDQSDPLLNGTETASDTGSEIATDTDSVTDTGSAVPTDSTPPVCGNGLLEVGEFCDDANIIDSDGCSPDCLTQDPNYDCSQPGQSCVIIATCGNGVLEGAEECDEGAENKTEGCSVACDAIADGWSCPRPGKSCVVLPVCGDSTRSKGEQCDDGNAIPGDGCSELCAAEPGYLCIPGKSCILLSCGDGNRTPDEACDDKNKTDGDGCSSMCEVEPGYRCSSLGCNAICGDGILLASEECDDENRVSGDGCSGQCKVEPYYQCTEDSPSVCISTIACGNGLVEPGEVCDPGIAGHELCYDTGAAACKGYENNLIEEPVCGNHIIEYLEDCDGDNGQGCSALCEVEDGYACPVADYCYRVAECGDGIVQSGEKCDVGAVSSLACDECEVQTGWYCSGSPSVCVASVCQDGVKAPDEQCDDGNNISNDGCSPSCMVETGWICPPGIDCITDCGNGVRTGYEDCDDDNDIDNDGCTRCKVDPKYDCGISGTTCELTLCGDGYEEHGEGCDDGNLIAGDGCGPTCQLEPEVTVGINPVVKVTCGDGLVTSGEQCDDGNTDNKDGCSSTCIIEPGWECNDLLEYPDSLSIRIKYRDFRMRNRSGGHPHMRDPKKDANTPPGAYDPGIVGVVCDETDTDDSCGRLDTDGKPALAPGTHTTISGGSPAQLDWNYHAAAFALWYRDTNAAGVLDAASQVAGSGTAVAMAPMPATDVDTLQLDRQGATSAYVFQSDGNLFYPLGTTRTTNPVPMRGHGCTVNVDTGACDTWSGEQRNFHFTSELRYFFQYQGGETLTFFGDDDVWVFINGRLAVDIGGIHTTRWGRVVLGDDGALGAADDSTCSVNGGTTTPATCTLEVPELADTTDTRFGLEIGEVYEIVVFQAERSPVESNYRLTLDGFIAPRSNCYTTCGDGIIAGTELCDAGTAGNVDGVYGACNTSCTFTYCGDGVRQSSDEACDNGLNVDPPWAANLAAANASCTGCERPGYCGDSILQSAYEVCDDGVNDDSYGGCASDCQSLGGYCGDGTIDTGDEVCDPGPGGTFVTYLANGTGCRHDCQKAPWCGDLIRNGPEQCDGTAGCGADCQYPPRCGDGVLATDQSEECDFGDFAFDPADGAVYGSCSTECELGPWCGDMDVFPGMEECDDGPANDDSAYDGCTESCTMGPRCGDGVTQDLQGEDCDNGYNEDIYAYVSDACGENCTAVPYCGDGVVQDDFEWCDNGAANNDTLYDGCTTSCQWGGYCGDGVLQPGYETCDLGVDNAAWSPVPGGCGYDCQPSPYCGDGIRNGREACDNGTVANVGGYGGCNPDCTRAPWCGDKVIDVTYGEECDDGPIGSLKCSVECKARVFVE